MIAVAWAAIGLTTVTVGLLATALFRLDARISEMGATHAAAIDSLRAELSGFRSETNARFDRVDQRLDNLNVQFAEHIRRHAS